MEKQTDYSCDTLKNYSKLIVNLEKKLRYKLKLDYARRTLKLEKMNDTEKSESIYERDRNKVIKLKYKEYTIKLESWYLPEKDNTIIYESILRFDIDDNRSYLIYENIVNFYYGEPHSWDTANWFEVYVQEKYEKYKV